MYELFEYTPEWLEVCGALQARLPVLLSTSRFQGIGRFVDCVGRCFSRTTKARAIRIRFPASGASVDYGYLWQQVLYQSAAHDRAGVRNQPEYFRALGKLLANRNTPLLILLSIPDRRTDRDDWVRELFEIHQELNHASVHAGGPGLMVFASQTHALAFNSGPSSLTYYARVTLGPIGRESIAEALRCCERWRLVGGIKKSSLEAADTISAFSGGHAGLVLELWDAMRQCDSKSMRDALAYAVDYVRRSSVVMRDLFSALDEAPPSLAEVGTRFATEQFDRSSDPQVRSLYYLGALYRVRPHTMKLFDGAIGKMVRQIAKARRTSTIDATPRSEVREGQYDDDDFVVVHLSDLHVGRYYRHRLTWKGHSLNASAASAGELLKRDIESLKLVGRIDALVVTGDFVWEGVRFEEYLRAMDVLVEIQEALAIKRSRVHLVPGNHDIAWNPGVEAATSHVAEASHEFFDAFLKQFFGKANSPVMSIASRNGRRRLQILGLDSNAVEGPKAAGIGYVSLENLDRVSKMAEDGKHNEEETVRWVAVHHHLIPVTSTSLDDALAKRASVMANAAGVLDWALRMNVECILHGHEHQPYIATMRPWPAPNSGSAPVVTTVGAGSFGVGASHLGPFARQHYYILQRRRTSMVIFSRCIGDNGVLFCDHATRTLGESDLRSLIRKR